MSIDTQIYTDVDYEKDGKQMSILSVPQSTNTSGWATTFVPITVIKNGNGPTALLSGGNHGDEYEGQVSLIKIAREVKPEQIHGRIIIIPMLNRPAAENGTRLSPIDGKNMNRSFPGERNGSVTSIIAHYVAHALAPMADFVVDIHSGGRSAHMLPAVNMHNVANKDQMKKMIDAGIAWGAPYVFIYRDVAGEGLYPTYAENLGKVTLGTEIGSASQFGKEMLAITERGVKNVLKQQNILTGAIETAAQPQVVAAEQTDDYIMAPVSGIFEPFIDMGETVKAGQTVGQIYSVEQPFAEPTQVVARTSGIVMSRRAFPLTRQGDCVVVIVRPFAL